MDSTAIKLEPGTSAEESVAVILTEIDIEYPFIKKECPDSVSENNSGEMSSREYSNLEEVAIKPGETSYTEIDLEVPGIKKEYFKISERIHQAAGSINVELVPTMAEPRPREDREGIPYLEINTDLTDVKKKCSEHSESIAETAADMVTDLNILMHPGKKPHLCSYCNHSFSANWRLRRHLRTHTREKPHFCPHCNYSSPDKSNLARHLRTHTGGEKPYACPHCNYSCTDKSAITVHIRIHTGEKPYSCPHCNYSCSNKSDLTKHLRTHSGEKPHSCSQCNYSCSSKSDLTKHSRIHTGEKPHSCPQCNYCCSYKSALTVHLRTHTGKKPH